MTLVANRPTEWLQVCGNHTNRYVFCMYVSMYVCMFRSCIFVLCVCVCGCLHRLGPGIDFWRLLFSVQHYADGPGLDGRVPAVAATAEH